MAQTKYNSDSMIARRARILDTALEMMARDDGTFTMRDLAREADVATGTLYNLFGSQDAVVAEAVAQVFEDRVEGFVVDPGTDNIADIVTARNTAAYREIMRVPAYAKAMVQIYFSHDPDSPVREQLHDIPTSFWTDQLKRLDNEGALEDWVDIGELAGQMSAAAYTVVARWAAGDLTDDDLRTGSVRCVLMLLAGALTGKQRRHVVEKLNEFATPEKSAATSAA